MIGTRAQREMTEAGWTMRDGALRNAQGEAFPTVEIMYSANSPRYRDMASAMADMWQRALGVQCSVRSRDQHGFKDALKRGDFMIARGGWYGDYGDPTTWLDLARSDDGNNDRRYANPDYDALLDRAAMELDPAKRLALLEQAETMLVERDLPMLPICHYVTVYMYDPARLQGISRHPRLEQYVGRLGLVPTAP
jgi:oligopeptide transport system substrate-binding protein